MKFAIAGLMAAASMISFVQPASADSIRQDIHRDHVQVRHALHRHQVCHMHHHHRVCSWR